MQDRGDMMKVTQDMYQQAVFYCNGVYKDLAYPDTIKRKNRISTASGFCAEFFETEEYDIIVFCGTNSTSIRDWMANIKMALGMKPVQFIDALEFVLKKYNPHKPTIICGHSLGGAIVEYCVSSINNEKLIGITFNGAGIKHICQPQYPQNVHHFITKNDILNRIMRKMPFSYFKHVGEIIMIEDDNWNWVKSHSDFHSFMKYKAWDKTNEEQAS